MATTSFRSCFRTALSHRDCKFCTWSGMTLSKSVATSRALTRFRPFSITSPLKMKKTSSNRLFRVTSMIYQSMSRALMLSEKFFNVEVSIRTSSPSSSRRSTRTWTNYARTSRDCVLSRSSLLLRRRKISSSVSYLRYWETWSSWSPIRTETMLWARSSRSGNPTSVSQFSKSWQIRFRSWAFRNILHVSLRNALSQETGILVPSSFEKSVKHLDSSLSSATTMETLSCKRRLNSPKATRKTT